MVGQRLEDKIDEVLVKFGELENLLEKAGDISKLSETVSDIKTNHLEHLKEDIKWVKNKFDNHVAVVNANFKLVSDSLGELKKEQKEIKEILLNR